jgi:mycothione reductase
MEIKNYDVIVIGSGGGAKITRPAANLGHKVAIIEKGAMGGTCLNHGCIPSKMLIHPADIASHITSAHRFEIDVNTNFSVRFKDLVSRVTATVTADSESIPPVYEKHPNIDLYRGEAKFVGHKTIEVNGTHLKADKIFIVTGAKANIPPIEGLKDTPYLTYKEALRNTVQPQKLIVIGGGYIAVELGYFYAALGTDTTFLVRSDMVRGEDKDIQTEFQTAFAKHYDVRRHVDISNVTHDGQLFHVTFTHNNTTQTMTCDALLVATGVVPNTDMLNLQSTGVQTDENGYITVDDYLQTSTEGIYAFGDVIGRHLFRHTANFEGEYLFDSVFMDMFAKPISYPPIPHAIFSNPQIGGVGATEQQLIDKGIPYVVGLNHYKNSAMGMALLSEHGFAKLLFHKTTQKLLGAHIIGDEASNMVHMLIAFMKMNASLDDILGTIYIHPALPEIVRNAARKAKAIFEEINKV